MATELGARPATATVADSSRADAVSLLTFYVVTLYAIPSPMLISALGQVGGPSTIAALVCLGWWLWALFTRSLSGFVHGHEVRAAAVALLLVLLLNYAHSAAIALPFDERSPANAGLIRMLGFIGVLVLLADGVPTRERLWTVVQRLSLVLGALSVLALVQIATRQSWVDRLSIPGLSTTTTLGVFTRGILFRPAGTSTHPIEFAAVLAMGMPLVFAAAAAATQHRGLYRAIAALVPFVLLMTGSRTAIVCGVVAFVWTMVGWSGRAQLWGIAAGLLAVIVMFVALPGYVGTLRGLFQGAADDPSVKSRTDSYRIVFDFWQHHVWMGRGYGTFLPKYWILDNMWLNLLICVGVIGIVAVAGLIVTACWSAVHVARRAAAPPDRQLAMGAAAGAAAGAVSMGTFDSFGFAQATGMLFVLLGICGAVRRLSVVPERARTTGRATARRPTGVRRPQSPRSHG